MTEDELDMTEDELREALAEYAHDAWSRWMQHLFGRGEDIDHFMPRAHAIYGPDVDRWKRQMVTDYLDLSEQGKESDRKEADIILEILKETKS